MTGAISLAGIAGAVRSVHALVIVSAIAVAASGIAGLALWRLAGCGARCDARITQARADGSEAVQKLAADQQAAINLLAAKQNAELLRAWTAAQNLQGREVTRWRTRWRDAGPVTGCAVAPEQAAAINAALRSGGAE